MSIFFFKFPIQIEVKYNSILSWKWSNHY